MKIVINSCYGGFGLSRKAIQMYADLKGIVLSDAGWFGWDGNDHPDLSPYDIERNDEVLVRVVESLGQEASNRYSELKVVNIPDGIEWDIVEHDGFEHVAERHQTWR